jgi:predicted double-glycine peptidase
MMLLTLLAFCMTSIAAQNRVIEITTSNVQLVLRTVDQLHLLLHDPSCQHSRDYAQKFLEVKTPLQLGITDCQR